MPVLVSTAFSIFLLVGDTTKFTRNHNIEHYPQQPGGDSEEVVSQAANFLRQQVVSLPRDCMGSFSDSLSMKGVVVCCLTTPPPLITPQLVSP